MTLTKLLHSIKDDVDLLTRGDAWLEHERKVVSSDLQNMAAYLTKVETAQKIKRLLQDENLVAVQRIERSPSNDPSDIVIELMKLPDALKLVENCQDTLDKINAAGQLATWSADGHDIITSRSLRS